MHTRGQVRVWLRAFEGYGFQQSRALTLVLGVVGLATSSVDPPRCESQVGTGVQRRMSDSTPRTHTPPAPRKHARSQVESG